MFCHISDLSTYLKINSYGMFSSGICSCCGYKTRYVKLLLRHYTDEHASDPNFVIRCGIDQCLNSYNKVVSFKKHLYRKHIKKEESLLLDSAVEDELNILTGDTDKLEQASGSQCSESETNVATSETGLEQNILKFILNLRVKKNVSEDVTQLIVEKFGELVDNCLGESKIVSAQLSKQFNDSNSIITTQLCQPLQELKSKLQGLNTKYLQNTKIKQGPYVSPIELNVQDKDKIVYIPILETLKLFLRHDDILSFIFQPSQKLGNNIISDFSCSNRYHDSGFFSSPNTIQILLYIDDFTLTNPLGTSAKQHKICAIYFTIGNIPYHKRSQLYTIQLVSLFPSVLIKKLGFKILLKQFIKDLQTLEGEGIDIDTPTGVTRFHGSISVLIADNLAAHQIGGFLTSFSAFRRCRFCNVTSETMQIKFHEREFELRTPNSYNAQVEQINLNPQLSSVYGLHSSSVLNELQHFHVCWGSPSDIAHDLFEGYCQDLLKVVIEHCLEAKFFDLKFLNTRLRLFPFSGRDSINKPAPIPQGTSQTKITVKQTAAQCHNLVTILPLLVAHRIPKSDPYWQCYLLFLNCLDYILAPALHLGQIKFMEEIIIDLITAYANLNAIHIKPKLHFALHYGTQYRTFGPLINYSTLRFEGKHSNLKSIFSTCKNYRNPCLTIATRHQYLQCLHNMNNNFLSEPNPKFAKKVIYTPVSKLNTDVQTD